MEESVQDVSESVGENAESLYIWFRLKNYLLHLICGPNFTVLWWVEEVDKNVNILVEIVINKLILVGVLYIFLHFNCKIQLQLEDSSLFFK